MALWTVVLDEDYRYPRRARVTEQAPYVRKNLRLQFGGHQSHKTDLHINND
jgi:hypothetical protein